MELIFQFVNADNVLSNLASLRHSLSPGPIGIPSCIHKNSVLFLAGPLTAMFAMTPEYIL